MIEEMTEAVGAALGLRQQNRHIEALARLDELLKKRFRLPLPLLESLPPEQIIDLFRMGGTVEVDKLQQASRLLEEAGRTRQDMGEPDQGLQLLMKALHLYVYSALNGASREPLQLPGRIAAVHEQVKEYLVPLELDKLLAAYFEREGLYAQADEIWFDLGVKQKPLLHEAVAFYDRLLQRPDEELERGGLSRTEAEQGKEELLQLE
jgi:tetratricopeptide (TPR) repeat protein